MEKKMEKIEESFRNKELIQEVKRNKQNEPSSLICFRIEQNSIGNKGEELEK